MAENAETEIITIASPGDVILVVGTTTQLKLKVSSATLAGASKVFAALLGPNFSEGQDAGTAMQPKEIKLPDDDATAMSDMCYFLHGKIVKALLKKAGIIRVLNFAIVVDKYDCADALRLQSQAILLEELLDRPTPNMDVLGRQMVSAYLMDSARAFRMVTRQLIETTTEEFTDLLQEEWGKLVPSNIVDTLERKRAKAQGIVVFDLPVLGMPTCASCDNYDPSFMKSLTSAFGVSYWPPNCKPGGRLTIEAAIQCINRLDTVERSPSCKHTGRKDAIYARQFRVFAGQLKAACAGLCLDCIGEGNTDLTRQCSNDDHY